MVIIRAAAAAVGETGVDDSGRGREGRAVPSSTR
jgi:hypothetical protein